MVDLDGTLLNKSSRVSDRVAKVLLEASKDESTLIVVATGKARPAAKAALATNPLLKDSLIVSGRRLGFSQQVHRTAKTAFQS